MPYPKPKPTWWGTLVAWVTISTLTVLKAALTKFTEIFSIFNASNFSTENFTFANWDQTDGSNNDHHRVDINGTASGDTLTGSDLSDFLIGNAGNDTLNAGEGGDFIGGGLGKDTMTGGDGSDNFYFDSKAESKKGAARDVILDFNSEDHIQLTGIDAKQGAGNQAFLCFRPLVH